MALAHTTLRVQTHGKSLVEITGDIADWVKKQAIRSGLLNIFITHTSASLLIQENADPDVLADMESFFERLVPENGAGYRHTMEGPDDMPAHIRAALTQVQLSVPVTDGSLGLGTWQGIYLYEHRDAPHVRKILLNLLGE
jgi:secondary thiamine-phosphate synthase enzyme